MPSSSRPDPALPEPGTPAWVALTDQLDSASQHARRVAADMVRGSGGHLLGVVDSAGPWTRTLLATVAAGRCQVVCPHLLAGSAVRPLYVLAPHALGCWPCFLLAVRLRQDSSESCEVCGQTGIPVGVLVVQRSVFVALGELCRGCLAAELPPV